MELVSAKDDKLLQALEPISDVLLINQSSSGLISHEFHNSANYSLLTIYSYFFHVRQRMRRFYAMEIHP